MLTPDVAVPHCTNFQGIMGRLVRRRELIGGQKWVVLGRGASYEAAIRESWVPDVAPIGVAKTRDKAILPIRRSQVSEHLVRSQASLCCAIHA